MIDCGIIRCPQGYTGETLDHFHFSDFFITPYNGYAENGPRFPGPFTPMYVHGSSILSSLDASSTVNCIVQIIAVVGKSLDCRSSHHSTRSIFVPFIAPTASTNHCVAEISSEYLLHHLSTVQIIRRNQQFQTQLRRNLHIRDVLALGMFLAVIEVFADFLEHDATIILISILHSPSPFRLYVVWYAEKKGKGGKGGGWRT
jgi:hypothetical protein